MSKKSIAVGTGAIAFSPFIDDILKPLSDVDEWVRQRLKMRWARKKFFVYVSVIADFEAQWRFGLQLEMPAPASLAR